MVQPGFTRRRFGYNTLWEKCRKDCLRLCSREIALHPLKEIVFSLSFVKKRLSSLFLLYCIKRYCLFSTKFIVFFYDCSILYNDCFTSIKRDCLRSLSLFLSSCLNCPWTQFSIWSPTKTFVLWGNCENIFSLSSKSLLYKVGKRRLTQFHVFWLRTVYSEEIFAEAVKYSKSILLCWYESVCEAKCFGIHLCVSLSWSES